MKKKELDIILPTIIVVRGVKAILDVDLASLYEVETKRINQAVKRNAERFPDDFMFQLTASEFEILKSQTVTSSWGGRRKQPYAFTELGIAMLSSVLRSTKAIEVNISIMRAFVSLRKMVSETDDLKETVKNLQKEYNKKFNIIFQTLNGMLKLETKGKNIGFIWPKNED